ncbi:hypothetical protein [Knoellia remsis]|nr:hypothetical protein [Knoellia remsis]
MTMPRGIRYAVLAAAVVLLAGVVGWLTAPGTEGLEGEWETAAVGGDVLGGRALVAGDANVAIDLVTGTRITLGSVTGGTKAIGGGRLLILRTSTLDGAGLDGRSRWTWQGPPAHTLRLVAGSPSTTVVQACGGTPVSCRLIGVDGNGKESWQTPQPTATGTGEPVVGEDGSLPSVGVLRTKDGTLVLVDPSSSRITLRTDTEAAVGRDGVLVLGTTQGGRCRRTTFETIDRSTTVTTPGSCAEGNGGLAAGTAPGVTVRSARVHSWWWPFGDGRPTLEVSGRHTGRVVGDDPLRALRVDDAGTTVRNGDVIRRYGYK